MIPVQEALTPVRARAAAPLAAGGRSRLLEFQSRRNETALELMRALAQSFPTVARMLGEEAFFDVAAEFVAQQSPIAPASTFYGDRFPDLLRQIGASAANGYIADVAAIDAARIASRQISEAAAAPYLRRGNLFADPLARAALHPSSILLQSKFPAVTGWRVNQPRGDRWVRRWSPEDALITCTRLDAEVWRLPDGGFAFLSALIVGVSLADAIAAASRASPSFDPAEMAAILNASDIVIDVRPASRSRDRRGAGHRARSPHIRPQAKVA